VACALLISDAWSTMHPVRAWMKGRQLGVGREGRWCCASEPWRGFLEQGGCQKREGLDMHRGVTYARVLLKEMTPAKRGRVPVACFGGGPCSRVDERVVNSSSTARQRWASRQVSMVANLGMARATRTPSIGGS
jgi:hypothetical protein